MFWVSALKYSLKWSILQQNEAVYLLSRETERKLNFIKFNFINYFIKNVRLWVF